MPRSPQEQQIRVRFAPSPTGSLHIGSARTALFNFLFAKKHHGSFILRIEDTDPQRSKPIFEKDILESLQWLGILWDEGPYRQSERGAIYKKCIKKLISEDKAYHCFCSPEELKSMKEYQIRIGQPPRYSGKCRQLDRGEVEKKLIKGTPAIIRLKVFPEKIKFEDLIRKDLEFDADLIGDFPLAKKRGEDFLPLYNFAVVCDDFEMKISHVIRGEDHISNTPKQILLQKALGFPQPKYAHLPLILGPDKSKLSKRHGAASVTDCRKQGFLSEALINFIAFLGWSPGGEREIFSLASLVKEFSLERVQKGGAVFNIKRLHFLNGFYIRQKPLNKLTELCLPYLIKAGLITELMDEFSDNKNKNDKSPETFKLFQEGRPQFRVKETGEIIDFAYLEKITGLYQERLKESSEIVNLIDFFFKEKLEYEKKLLIWKEMTDKELKTTLKKLAKILSKIKPEDWNKNNLEHILMKEAEALSPVLQPQGNTSAPPDKQVGYYKVKDRGYLLWPLRVALTGKQASAPPFDIAEVLGKEKTLKRIREALGKR